MNKIRENKFVITPRFIFASIRNKWLSIFLFGAGFAVLSFFIAAFFITPQYRSTTDLLVNRTTSNLQQEYTQQQADLQVINTYKDVIKKSVVLSPVLKQIKEKDNYNGSLENLQGKISLSNEANSQVFSVTVSDKNPYVARDIANSISQVFVKKIKLMMNVDNVTVVTKAKVSPNPIFPNKKLFTIIGLVVGLFLGFVIAIARDIFDNTVKDTTFITDELGMVNLGQIYHIDKKKRQLKAVNVLKSRNSVENSGRSRV